MLGGVSEQAHHVVVVERADECHQGPEHPAVEGEDPPGWMADPLAPHGNQTHRVEGSDQRGEDGPIGVQDEGNASAGRCHARSLRLDAAIKLGPCTPYWSAWRWRLRHIWCSSL